jgi:hypothetical protein
MDIIDYKKDPDNFLWIDVLLHRIDGTTRRDWIVRAFDHSFHTGSGLIWNWNGVCLNHDEWSSITLFNK